MIRTPFCGRGDCLPPASREPTESLFALAWAPEGIHRNSNKPNILNDGEFCAECGDTWPCPTVQIDTLRTALDNTRKAMLEAVAHSVKFDNAVLYRVALSWLATYATRDGSALLNPVDFPMNVDGGNRAVTLPPRPPGKPYA